MYIYILQIYNLIIKTKYLGRNKSEIRNLMVKTSLVSIRINFHYKEGHHTVRNKDDLD